MVLRSPRSWSDAAGLMGGGLTSATQGDSRWGLNSLLSALGAADQARAAEEIQAEFRKAQQAQRQDIQGARRDMRREQTVARRAASGGGIGGSAVQGPSTRGGGQADRIVDAVRRGGSALSGPQAGIPRGVTVPDHIKKLNPNIDRALNFDISTTNPHAGALADGLAAGGQRVPRGVADSLAEAFRSSQRQPPTQDAIRSLVDRQVPGGIRESGGSPLAERIVSAVRQGGAGTVSQATTTKPTGMAPRLDQTQRLSPQQQQLRPQLPDPRQGGTPTAESIAGMVRSRLGAGDVGNLAQDTMQQVMTAVGQRLGAGGAPNADALVQAIRAKAMQQANAAAQRGVTPAANGGYAHPDSDLMRGLASSTRGDGTTPVQKPDAPIVLPPGLTWDDVLAQLHPNQDYIDWPKAIAAAAAAKGLNGTPASTPAGGLRAFPDAGFQDPGVMANTTPPGTFDPNAAFPGANQPIAQPGAQPAGPQQNIIANPNSGSGITGSDPNLNGAAQMIIQQETGGAEWTPNNVNCTIRPESGCLDLNTGIFKLTADSMGLDWNRLMTDPGYAPQAVGQLLSGYANDDASAWGGPAGMTVWEWGNQNLPGGGWEAIGRIYFGGCVTNGCFVDEQGRSVDTYGQQFVAKLQQAGVTTGPGLAPPGAAPTGTPAPGPTGAPPIGSNAPAGGPAIPGSDIYVPGGGPIPQQPASGTFDPNVAFPGSNQPIAQGNPSVESQGENIIAPPQTGPASSGSGDLVIDSTGGALSIADISYGFGAPGCATCYNADGTSFYDYAEGHSDLPPHSHTGIDVPIGYGQQFYAPISGTVVCQGTNDGPGAWGTGCGAFGNMHGGGAGRIEVYDDKTGISWIFGHADKSNVSVGQQINPGDPLGTSGWSEDAAHYHLEARVWCDNIGTYWIVDPQQAMRVSDGSQLCPR